MRPPLATTSGGRRPAGCPPARTPSRPGGPAPARARAAPAAPPKPPEPDPDEVTALRELVPDLTWERRHGYVEVKVPSDQLVPVARTGQGLGYDYLSAVTAVDWRDRVEMLYHCYGWDYVETPGCVVIRADLPPEPEPALPEPDDRLGRRRVPGARDLRPVRRQVRRASGPAPHPAGRQLPGPPAPEGLDVRLRVRPGQAPEVRRRGPGCAARRRGGLPPCLKASRSRSSESDSPNEMTLNMGPQHPVTHGVFRLIMQLGRRDRRRRQAR